MNIKKLLETGGVYSFVSGEHKTDGIFAMLQPAITAPVHIAESLVADYLQRNAMLMETDHVMVDRISEGIVAVMYVREFESIATAYEFAEKHNLKFIFENGNKLWIQRNGAGRQVR